MKTSQFFTTYFVLFFLSHFFRAIRKPMRKMSDLWGRTDGAIRWMPIFTNTMLPMTQPYCIMR